MLFNSYEFIFIFLPIVLLGFLFLGSLGRYQIAIAWLVFSSLFFYGWWNPIYLILIISSVIFNYFIGIFITNKSQKKLGFILLTIGVLANLGLLGYFKYANFLIDNWNIAFETEYNLKAIILPLAISFFTFQQIAYLVDTYRAETEEHNFLYYALFITFFPQLIAGPIVHHKEMLPQFLKASIFKLNHKHLSVGIMIFSIGLFKKVVFADTMASYATPVFNAANEGITLTFFEAWGGGTCVFPAIIFRLFWLF